MAPAASSGAPTRPSAINCFIAAAAPSACGQEQQGGGGGRRQQMSGWIPPGVCHMPADILCTLTSVLPSPALLLLIAERATRCTCHCQAQRRSCQTAGWPDLRYAQLHTLPCHLDGCPPVLGLNQPAGGSRAWRRRGHKPQGCSLAADFWPELIRSGAPCTRAAHQPATGASTPRPQAGHRHTRTHTHTPRVHVSVG